MGQFCINCQNVNQLSDSLSNELFNKSDKQVYLYTLLNDCNIEKIDSTLQIRIGQPDAKKCMEIMRSIVLNKDTCCFDKLLEIYNRQMIFFSNEWLKPYNSYRYCHVLRDQFYIISSFERMLLSLDLKRKKWTDLQIFEFYKEEILNHEKYFQAEKLEKLKVINETIFYNVDFRSISFSLYRPSPIFDPYEPFYKEMKPFFIQYVQEIKENRKNINSEWFLYDSKDILSTYDDENLKKAFVDNYEFLNKKEFVLLTKYCRYNYSPLIVKKLTNTLMYGNFCSSYMVDNLLSNEKNKPIFYGELLEFSKSDFEKSILFIENYITYKKDLLKDFKKIDNLNNSDKKLIKKIVAIIKTN